MNYRLIHVFQHRLRQLIVLQTHGYDSIQMYVGNAVQKTVMFMTVLINVQE